MCIEFRHKTFIQADIRFRLTLKARVRICSARCEQFRRSEPFSTGCPSAQQPTSAQLDLQRREAIIQGADAIMKISNDAAKEFDKTVLTAMLKVTTCQACFRPPSPPHSPSRSKFQVQRSFFGDNNAHHFFPPVPRYAPLARNAGSCSHRRCASKHVGQSHKPSITVRTCIFIALFSNHKPLLFPLHFILFPSHRTPFPLPRDTGFAGTILFNTPSKPSTRRLHMPSSSLKKVAMPCQCRLQSLSTPRSDDFVFCDFFSKNRF
jgi:hypothetical protein